jgi:eukaryotic-like serine/threonine-protein kinase
MPLYERSLVDIIPDLQADRDRALRIFNSVLDAMEYAHGQKVIHRDLKPENVLLGVNDFTVITDFGLGRALDALTSRATGTGAWVGTFGCMAPEQMTHAGHADTRSDIFSLVRMLYEMLTGEPRLAVQDATKLPVGLAEVVQKCTLTDPDQRFQSIAEMRMALARVTNRKPRAEQSLQELIQKILAESVVTSTDVVRLANLIGLCREDPDLLHTVTVSLPIPAFTELDRNFPEIAKLLVRQFSEKAMKQGWDFNYTDVIGDTCARLYEATEQPEIKGIMAATALEVGASHNRFRVMDIAASLIARARNDTDALAVAHAIRPHNGQFGVVEQRLTVWKLHPALQELFAGADE